MGAHNDKDHRKLIKVSDNQPLSKDRLEKTMPKTLITDPERDTSPYNPNRPSYFNMQTKDNTNKRNPRDFEKAQSVVTKVFRQAAQYL